MSKPSSAAARCIEARVSDVIADHASSYVWVGFSGGVDSTALLLACREVMQQQPSHRAMAALHVNHGLQEDAAGWAEHCTDVCRRLDIRIEVTTAEVKASGNLEANARVARYAAYARYITGDALLLLGHHQQDQTETLLYRLFQGRGLLPMRAHGALGQGRFARPLLDLPLLDIDQDCLVTYVRSKGVSWVEDETNRDLRLTRNYLRHTVIPRLSARWPNVHRSMQRVADTQVETRAALQHMLARLDDKVPLSDLPLQPAVRWAWLRAFLQSRDVYRVSDKALCEFDRQTSNGGHGELDCGKAALHSYAGFLYFVVKHSLEDVPRSIALGEEIKFNHGCLSLAPAQAGDVLAFSYSEPLHVRFRCGGERLRVAGSGQTKTLKQIFAAARVPPWQRETYPLLYCNEALVCIPGLAVNLAETGKVLDGQLCRAEWRVGRGSSLIAANRARETSD